ncbi:hypothetical protein lerEdw1_010262, partial [Lerista edwardsae]
MSQEFEADIQNLQETHREPQRARKKIDSAKMFGFLASGCLLLVTLLGDPAEACVCVPSHPQDDYCKADVVVKAVFVGSTLESGWKRYEIQTTNGLCCFDRIETSMISEAHELLPLLPPSLSLILIRTVQVYKGSEAMQELRFLYTPNMARYCGYINEPLQGEEYVIAGIEYPPLPWKICGNCNSYLTRYGEQAFQYTAFPLICFSLSPPPGKLEKNRVMITLCSFIQPWSWLSPEQQRGMRLDYSKGCGCT